MSRQRLPQTLRQCLIHVSSFRVRQLACPERSRRAAAFPASAHCQPQSRKQSLSASILEPLSIESLSDPVKDTCAIRAGDISAPPLHPQSSVLTFLSFGFTFRLTLP